MQKRRYAGLCFNCDVKFTHGHRCAKPQLFLLDSGTRDGDDEDEDEPKIFLHAIFGWSNAQTMRVLVKIKFTEMIVLINSFFTHNFINGKLAESFKLPAMQIKPNKVKVANGDTSSAMENSRICLSWFKVFPLPLHYILCL